VTALQGVTHFADVAYTAGAPGWPGISYGEMLGQSEFEWSVFNLDAADVPSQRAAFDLHRAEAGRLLDAGLPLPAYGALLKMSHAFNVLDARGAVAVSDRAASFGDMRGLARRVSGLWLERREAAGWPLLKGGEAEQAAPAPPTPPPRTLPTAPADFLLEVGCEELPPDDADAAVSQLAASVPALLARLRLAHGTIAVDATPRRLVVRVASLAPRGEDAASRVRGPPAKAAFAPNGAPTKALLGFCAKNGVDAASVTVEADAKGVDYVFADVHEAGAPAAAALERELPALLAALAFPRTMRWAPGGPSFSRPVRWIAALHGEAALAFDALGVRSGSATRGVRDGTDAPLIELASASAHADALASQRIVMSASDREAAIAADAAAAAAAAGGAIPAGASTAGLLAEVARLVEAPTALAGAFDPAFLELPRDVLVMVMRKHQRYFPVEASSGGALLPAFVLVANGSVDAATVVAGNEAVLRARFEDASFFYRADLEKPLAAFVPALAGTAFHRELGSLLDKQGRVEGLLAPLASVAGLDAALPVAAAAARLARADAATAVVREMTALTGVMGRHYALKSGEPPAVADAIFEGALPRAAGDGVAASAAGALLAVADRLDSIVGLFAAGGAPTASADPYGLRRAAVGLLETALGGGPGGAGLDLDLPAATAAAAAAQPIPVPADVLDTALVFIGRRLEQLLLDRGVPAEAVRAALAARGANPRAAAATAADLAAELAKGPDAPLAVAVAALARPARISRGGSGGAPAATVDPALFDCDEERALAAALATATKAMGPEPTVAEFAGAAAQLAPAVDAFFSGVFVMTDDAAVRANRLALLRDVAALADGVAKLDELPGF